MKVSVYCLVYNHELYLRSALNGFVQQQTNFEYEVFVHDDASTDRSREIIEEYANKYPEIIKPIYQVENQYSKGIKILTAHILHRMQGEYIAVCEGDDYWIDSSKLQRQVDFLDSHPEYVACVHNTRRRNEKTGKECEMYHHESDDDISFYEVVQSGGYSYQTSSLMYRKEYAYNRPSFFAKAKGFGDYPLAIYLALSGKIRFLNRVMSVYRVDTKNSWTKRVAFDLKKRAIVCSDIAEMLIDVDEYTNYEYTDTVKKIILENQYLSLLFSQKYKELKKEPYREIHKNKPMSFKVKTFIKIGCIKIYQLYKTIVTK